MTPVTVIDCLCRQRLRDLASCSDTKDVDEPASSSARTLVHRPLFAVTRTWHVINRALGFIIGAACTVAEIFPNPLPQVGLSLEAWWSRE